MPPRSGALGKRRTHHSIFRWLVVLRAVLGRERPDMPVGGRGVTPTPPCFSSCRMICWWRAVCLVLVLRTLEASEYPDLTLAAVDGLLSPPY